MAELLVKAIDAKHDDPVEDARGCYKRGDIVDVRPDGFRWGNEEALPKFIIIKCPGIAVNSVQQYMSSVTQKTITQDKTGNFIEQEELVKRRQYSIDLDKHNGKELTLQKLNSLIKDKVVK